MSSLRILVTTWFHASCVVRSFVGSDVASKLLGEIHHPSVPDQHESPDVIWFPKKA